MTDTRGEIIVVLNSTEKHFPYADFSVTFDSTDKEILDAIAPRLLEEEGFDIREQQEEGLYTIKSVEESQSKYIFPKSTAGN
jgi:hypothetical protein